jgi:phosphatidylglycerophosphatase A
MTTTASANSEQVSRLPAPRWAWLLATFFGAGRLRPAPGTWGSLAALGLWLALGRSIPGPWRAVAALSISVLATILGIPAATHVARELGNNDPSCVVIDEVAGQMLALVAVPFSWQSLLGAFILFRAFDILKPPPIRQLEHLPGGVGIVLDDIGAGLYALGIVQLLLHFGVLNS